MVFNGADRNCDCRAVCFARNNLERKLKQQRARTVAFTTSFDLLCANDSVSKRYVVDTKRKQKCPINHNR